MWYLWHYITLYTKYDYCLRPKPNDNTLYLYSIIVFVTESHFSVTIYCSIFFLLTKTVFCPSSRTKCLMRPLHRRVVVLCTIPPVCLLLASSFVFDAAYLSKHADWWNASFASLCTAAFSMEIKSFFSLENIQSVLHTKYYYYFRVNNFDFKTISRITYEWSALPFYCFCFVFLLFLLVILGRCYNYQRCFIT